MPSNIVSLGYVTDAEMKKVFASSSALIIPSLDEGFGLPAVEAISQGLPVIASNIPSFKELLPNDYLIDTGSFDDSVDFINKLLYSESYRLEVFLQQAIAISGLSWDYASDMYLSTYQDVYEKFLLLRSFYLDQK